MTNTRLFITECRSRYQKLCMLAAVVGALWQCINPVRLHAAETGLPPSEQSEADELLELSIEQLMHVTVTSAGKKEQPLAETAAAIFVITGEDIRRGGFRSIPEALRLAPGIQVAQISANQWAITSRGFNSPFSNKLLVLIDGRTVYTPAFGGVFWDVQDTLLEDVDRIEVIRGPGGTLWGQNAVNGVINIITKQARKTQGAYVEAGAGTLERGFVGVRQGGTLGASGEYRIYGKYFNRANYANPDGSSHSDQWSQGRGGFRTDWRLTGEDRLTIQGDGYWGHEENQFLGISLTPPLAFKHVGSIQLGGGNLLARWTRKFSDTSELRLQTYADRTERTNLFMNEIRNTFDVDLQHRFQPFDRHDVVWGGQYQASHDQVKNNFRISFTPAEYTLHVASGFIQDDVTLIPHRLKLIAGVKVLHNSFTGIEYQPNGRLLWTPHQQHTLWAAISRAVRLPTRTQDAIRVNVAVTPNPGGSPSPVLTALFGNPSTQAEEVLAYEAGYRTQILPSLSLDVVGYYNVYRNIIPAVPGGALSLETTPGPPHILNPIRYSDGGSGHTYGVEVVTIWQATDAWKLTANYSWLEMMTRPSNTLNVVLSPSLNPHHQFRIRSQYDLPFHLQWDTGIYYTSGLTLTNVPGYTRVDTRLAWRPDDHWQVEVVGQNLFNKHHVEWYPAGAGALFNNSAIPRSVFVMVSWRY